MENIRIEFSCQEEEDWFVGSFVAISASDGKLLRDSSGSPIWEEDEESLVFLLRGMDYNNFGVVFVQDPEDFYEDDEGEWVWVN